MAQLAHRFSLIVSPYTIFFTTCESALEAIALICLGVGVFC